MKKRFETCLVILLLFTPLILSSCSSDIPSVDLSRITFGGVSVGDRFEQMKAAQYTEKTNASTHYNYNYEELSFSVDNEIISEIMASFGLANISVNGKMNCRSVDDIIAVLGKNYRSSWYDKEQSLMQIQYFDRENGLECAFVYDKNGGNLVWGIMENC